MFKESKNQQSQLLSHIFRKYRMERDKIKPSDDIMKGNGQIKISHGIFYFTLRKRCSANVYIVSQKFPLSQVKCRKVII